MERFTIEINQELGVIWIDIYDYKTQTKVRLEELELEKSEIGSMGWMSKFMINKLKPQFREIAEPSKE